MSRAAMQQALKVLENGAVASHGWVPDYDDAIAALRAALAEQAQPVADAARVIEWATSTPRKAAVHAFTEGPERQAAYWIEWAEARVVNRRLTTEQAQPVACKFSRTQVRSLWDNAPEFHEDATSFAAFERIVRLVEEAHRIGDNAPTPPAPVVPPGWRMVPVEPTQEMAAAGAGELPMLDGRSTWLLRQWQAMLAAAPEAPTPPAPQPLTDADLARIIGFPNEGIAAKTYYSIARAVWDLALKRMGVQR